MLGIRGSASSKSKSKPLRIKPTVPSISASDFTVGGECVVSLKNVSSGKAILDGGYVIIIMSLTPPKGKTQVFEQKSKISRKSISKNSININVSPSTLTTSSPVTVNVSLIVVSRGIESDPSTTTCIISPQPLKK